VLPIVVVRLVAALALVVASIALFFSVGPSRPSRLAIVPSLAFVAPALPRVRRLLLAQFLLAALPSARSRTVHFIAMDADPRFVAAAIEYYRCHPDARTSIGQPDEYDRLTKALGVAGGMPWTQ
jgi:hypothetical protein